MLNVHLAFSTTRVGELTAEAEKLRAILLVEAHGVCSTRGAAQLGLVTVSAVYDSGAKLLPAAQKYRQANWPSAGLETGWWPVLGGLGAGGILWCITMAAAAGAVSRGTRLHVTASSATYLSNGLAALLGEIVEALLALGVHPLWAMVGSLGTVLGIDVVAWVTMAFRGDPWPFQYARVVATAIQLIAKAASATVRPFSVKLPDATLLVSAQPHVERPMHACWCCLCPVGGIGQRTRTMQLRLLQGAMLCMLALHIKQRWLSSNVLALHLGIITLACGTAFHQHACPAEREAMHGVSPWRRVQMFDDASWVRGAVLISESFHGCAGVEAGGAFGPRAARRGDHGAEGAPGRCERPHRCARWGNSGRHPLRQLPEACAGHAKVVSGQVEGQEAEEGLLVLVVSIAAAAGAIGHTGFAVRVTVASAASFSSSISAMFGESLEGLLALGVRPLWSLRRHRCRVRCAQVAAQKSTGTGIGTGKRRARRGKGCKGSTATYPAGPSGGRAARAALGPGPAGQQGLSHIWTLGESLLGRKALKGAVRGVTGMYAVHWLQPAVSWSLPLSHVAWPQLWSGTRTACSSRSRTAGGETPRLTSMSNGSASSASWPWPALA